MSEVEQSQPDADATRDAYFAAVLGALLGDAPARLGFREAFELASIAYAAFEQSPFSSVLYDVEGHPVAVNTAFRTFWGVGLETAPAGYSVLSDPELERSGVLPLVRRAFRDGEPVVTPPVRYEIARLATTGAGRTAWTQGYFWPVKDARGAIRLVMLTHVDLTAPALVSQASAALASTRSVDDAVTTTLTALIDGFADACVAYLHDDTGALRLAGVAARDAALTRTIRAAAAQRRASTTAGELPLDEEALKRIGAQSILTSPIVARDHVLGSLTCIATGRARAFDDSDRAVVDEIARRTAFAIDSARLYRSEQAARAAAQHAADNTARLQAFTAALSEASTVKAVADVTLHHGMTALGAVAAGVCMVTPDGEHQALISVFAPGVDPDTVTGWETFPLAEPFPVNVAVRERTLVVMESLDEFRQRFPAIAQHIEGAGYQAYVAAPLELGGRAIGCINYNFAQQRSFSDDDRAFLLALARQATIALERARLFEAERSARARAESANRAKSQFLATMSHELRTPLNAVVGNVDLLEAEVLGPITEAQRRQIGRIKASASHLVSIIDEILTFARAEAGREQLRIATTDIVALTADSVALLEAEAVARNIDLRADLPDQVIEFATDPGKLRQILINLLGNAVKFTEEGEVVVRLRAEAERIEWRVRDTGPGIAPADIERIFEPFTQIDSSSTRTKGGTGLGLAVSRRLARLMSGDLSVTSTPGRGSEFVLQLPREMPQS